MGYPKILIIVTDNSSFDFASGRPFVATCVINPQLRSNGATEKEAVDNLKILIKAGCNSYVRANVPVKYATISFDDEFVKEVMDE